MCLYKDTKIRKVAKINIIKNKEMEKRLICIVY